MTQIVQPGYRSPLQANLKLARYADLTRPLEHASLIPFKWKRYLDVEQ